ncbi:MAG: prepilin-type N-terminal cleavage/methylation domain-containing protein [Pyrinomonadaceae bacterium]|nr:prepilin-type N-terminal cleavage/methylation domain-containing protein [Pyrinomonadaceae bacterium]
MKTKSEIKRKHHYGFSLVELLIVIVIIGILAAVAIPNLLKARRSSNEASAISSLSLLFRAEQTFKNSSGNGNYTSLTGLYANGHIDSVLGSVPHRKSGYEFQIDLYAPSPGVEAKFDLRGRPVIHSLTNSATGTGARDFGTNEVGGIFETTDNTPVLFDSTTRLAQGTAVPVDR